MPDVPNGGQLVLLFAAMALIAASAVVSVCRLWWERTALGIVSRVCLYIGIALGIGLLAWHSHERGSWRPLEDNFDSLVWLALLLALFVSYTQGTRPLRGLDWFVLPIAVALLAAAAVFGRETPHEYVDRTWFWVHGASAYGGAAA